ncbi:unnamed protein product [Arctia plantaginis]|uniref:Uncharacterized protein n=1 Tax=Arctia plantaginis TaxID=874455 RepID=A0A8S1ANA6_ARCPL|nr:unnamed protein product [Arctia plantaginis]
MDILRTVYFSVAQSIIGYCIGVWGGAAKTHVLPLERAQRAVLRVMTFRPFGYSTSQLYSDCKVLSVRQLFVLETVTRKHASLVFNPNFTNKRRSYKVCQNKKWKTSIASRHYGVLSSHLYNTVNRYCNIYTLLRSECKKKVSDWLMLKSYEETEGLLKISIL